MFGIREENSAASLSLRSNRSYRFRQIGLTAQRPSVPDSAPTSTAERLDLVREYGDFSLAYATAVQAGLKYFGDHRGYLAYDERLGYTFVLGDPVAAPQDRAHLVQQFLREHRRVAFCQISAATAKLVRDCQFYINEMGIESVIELPNYNFRGQEKQWLRTADAWTSRRGYVTREESTQQVGRESIEAVSAAWRATRTVKRKEVRFLNRPFVMNDEPGTRRFFFFDPADRLLAFVFFDPIYRFGELIGYVACSKRRHPDAPSYAEQAIMKHAIEVFQREGCQELRLGLSPLAEIEDREFSASWFAHCAFRFAFASRWVNRFIYNVQGHAEYKRRFRGRAEKVYFATQSHFDPVQLAAFIKVCKIL